MDKKIVIIEDDKSILELLKVNLEKEGFITRTFIRGADGLEHLQKHSADLLILDLMLPDIGGIEICKELRAAEKTRFLPIIILTAKGDEVDKVLGLELGADDYIVKPFSPRELIARIKAIFRRVDKEEPHKTVAFGDLTIDPKMHKTLYKGDEIVLTATEFRILETLIRQPGRVFTRDNLLDVMDKTIVDRNIDVHIRNLRKKLEDAGKFIKTIRGVGYKIDT